MHNLKRFLPYVVLGMFFAVAASGQPTLDLVTTIPGTQVIGDDVVVILQGAAPNTPVTFLVWDETGFLVAEVSATTDAQGDAVGVPWTRTGVEGCDPGTVVNLGEYRFADYSQAESILDGRTFQVTAVDPVTGGTMAAIPLSLSTDDNNVNFFLGDGSGCPRFEMDAEESVYLVAIHLTATRETDLRFFLIPNDPALQPGSSLPDVRTGGSQVISWSAGTDTFVELAWVGPTLEGLFDGVIRLGSTDPTPIMGGSDVQLPNVLRILKMLTDPTCGVCPPASPQPESGSEPASD